MAPMADDRLATSRVTAFLNRPGISAELHVQALVAAFVMIGCALHFAPQYDNPRPGGFMGKKRRHLNDFYIPYAGSPG